MVCIENVVHFASFISKTGRGGTRVREKALRQAPTLGDGLSHAVQPVRFFLPSRYLMSVWAQRFTNNAQQCACSSRFIAQQRRCYYAGMHGFVLQGHGD